MVYKGCFVKFIKLSYKRFKLMFIEKVFLCTDGSSASRVRRPETRLTVYWVM